WTGRPPLSTWRAGNSPEPTPFAKPVRSPPGALASFPRSGAVLEAICGGLRSLAAVAGRRSTSFHGADGADALQFLGIGQEWYRFRSIFARFFKARASRQKRSSLLKATVSILTN